MGLRLLLLDHAYIGPSTRIKLSRGMILSEYLCILRGNVARPVCCKSSQELPLHLLRGSDGNLCMQHALACMPHGVQS